MAGRLQAERVQAQSLRTGTAPDRHEQLLGRTTEPGPRSSSSVTPAAALSRLTAARSRAEHDVDHRRACSDSRTSSEANSSSRAIRRGSASTIVTRAPSEA